MHKVEGEMKVEGLWLFCSQAHAQVKRPAGLKWRGAKGGLEYAGGLMRAVVPIYNNMMGGWGAVRW